MKKQGWVGMVAATAWAAACVATMASAGPFAGDEPKAARPGRDRGGAVAEYLGLTDDQKASWRSLHEQRREEMKPLVEEGRALRERLREAVKAQSPDPATVGEATLALEAHRRQVRAQQEAFRARLESLLSPEQKEKLKAYEAARRAQREGRDGRRGPRPHPRPQERRPVEG